MDRNPPRVLASLVLCLAIQLGIAGAAHAVIIDITGFENGDLIPSGSEIIGDAVRRPRFSGVLPTEGRRLFMVTNDEAGGATDATTIENAMAIPLGTIDAIYGTIPTSSTLGPQSGSAFQITFTAEAGDELLFDWDLVTDATTLEDVYTDFGWGHLSYEGSSVDQWNLGNLNEGPFVATPRNGREHTDWQTQSVVLANAGSYTVTLGVMDVQDTFVDSYMLFDWFRLRRAPEPGTASLVMLGLLGLGWQGRRRDA